MDECLTDRLKSGSCFNLSQTLRGKIHQTEDAPDKLQENYFKFNLNLVDSSSTASYYFDNSQRKTHQTA